MDDRVLMIRIRFSCALRLYETAKCLMAIFVPCKNEGEDLYVKRKIL